MKVHTFAITALVATILAASLAGCEAKSQDAIGISLPSEAGRWGEVAEVLRDRLGDAGYYVDLRVAGGDIPTQVRQLDALIDADPLALIVAPVDATSLTPVLDEASAMTEVVVLGTMVRDTDEVDRLVAFDAEAEGVLQATALLHGLGLVDESGIPTATPPIGPFRIELFAGSSDEERTEPAFAGSMAVLGPYIEDGTLVVGSGESRLADGTTLRGNGAAAKSRMTQLLHDHYRDPSGQGWPDAVLAPSDAIARGVAEALVEAGSGEDFPIVTGRGAELRSVVALLDGLQYATLLEDPRRLAAEAADRVIEALRAGPTSIPNPSPTPAIDNGVRQVPVSLVAPQTVLVGDIDALLIASGYWTKSQVDAAAAE